ncbi:hypothetical protein DP939_14860 [Spongiactinospora rosea]|uniref:ABC-2 type transporter domain-containing protein n=1 Tax=Spongiactinospora rosea TaxID=2248750 RepID=A0A366M0S1_9ACTN|nr:hypothetical protein [Spongiactinospora rosea]RBQ19219.1 hypothetical protein DP939_14860 [Spongiactinospora rosea]
MRRALRVLRWSLRLGLSDLGTVHTWRSWVFGWLTRVVAQVLFFSLSGLLARGAADVRFMLIGSAAVIAVLEAMSIIVWAAADRHMGTAGLVVISPTGYFPAFAARGLYTVLTGTASSVVALAAGAAVLRVALSPAAILLAVPVIALGATSAYFFAGAVAALVVKTAGAHWFALNVSYLLIMICGGFVIPFDALPYAVRAVMSAMPYTHALAALRAVLEPGMDLPFALAQCGWEIAVTVTWAVIATIVFDLAIRRERRLGGALLG